MRRLFLLLFILLGVIVFTVEVTEEYKDELFYDLIYKGYKENEITSLINKYNYTFRKNGKYSYNMDDLMVIAITNENKYYSIEFIKKLDRIYKDNWSKRYVDYSGKNLNSPYRYALGNARFDIFDYFISKSYKIPNYKESIFQSDVFNGILDSIEKGNSIKVIEYLEEKGLSVDLSYYEKDVFKYLASLDLETFQNLFRITNLEDFLKKENSYEKILISFGNDIDMGIQAGYIDFLLSKISIDEILAGIEGFQNKKGIQAEIFFYMYKNVVQPDKRFIENYFSYLYDYSVIMESFEMYFIYFTDDMINNTEKRFEQKDILNYIFNNKFDNFVFVMNRDEIKKVMEIVFDFKTDNNKDFYLSKITHLMDNNNIYLAKKYLLKGIAEGFWTLEDIALYYDFRDIEEHFADFFLVNNINLTFKTEYKTMDRNIDLMEYFVEKDLFYKDFLEKYNGDFKNLFFSTITYSSLETIEYIANKFKDKIPSDSSSVSNYFMAVGQSKNPEKYYFVKSFFKVKELDSWAIEKLIHYNWDLDFIKKIMNDSKIDFSEKTYTYLTLAATYHDNPEIFSFFETKGIYLDKEKRYSFGDPILFALWDNTSFSIKKFLVDYYGVNYSYSERYSLLSKINPNYYKTIKYIYEHEDFEYKDLEYHTKYNLIDKDIFDGFDIEARFIVESDNLLTIDYFLNQIQRINMLSERWRSLFDFAVINDNFFAQKYILLNNYDVDYGVRGIGSDELRIGDMELNNVFHFLARIEGYYSDIFYNYISEDDIKTLMNISNGDGLNPLMSLFKIGNFDNVGKVSFFLTYTDFNHLDYNDNNFLHHYAMKENIFSYFKDYVYKDNLPSELFKAKNKEGFTPYELALETGNLDKAKHIKSLQEYYK